MKKTNSKPYRKEKYGIIQQKYKNCKEFLHAYMKTYRIDTVQNKLMESPYYEAIRPKCFFYDAFHMHKYYFKVVKNFQILCWIVHI